MECDFDSAGFLLTVLKPVDSAQSHEESVTKSHFFHALFSQLIVINLNVVLS